MKNIEELIKSVDTALEQADLLATNSIHYAIDKEPIKSTKYVLNLLKEEFRNSEDGSINVRILRAMHDLGMAAFKEFENSELEIAINNVINILYHNVPVYKTLTPLRMDFGESDPI